MKLQILAAAVAASLAFPMAAQADVKVSGDVGVFYDTQSEDIHEIGSEINFDGKTEVNGVTYMGHMELDVNNSGDTTLRMDEVRVGAKGGFGEVWLGDVDNACDQFDPDSNDIWLGGNSDVCSKVDKNNIVYKRDFGRVGFAVSHNPERDINAVGAQFQLMEGVKANLGYEDIDGGDNNTVIGLEGEFKGVALSLEANDNDKWGLNASYSANGHTVWADYGDNDGDDAYGVGYRMSHGQMDYIIEYGDDGSDDRTIAGMRYRF